MLDLFWFVLVLSVFSARLVASGELLDQANLLFLPSLPRSASASLTSGGCSDLVASVCWLRCSLNLLRLLNRQRLFQYLWWLLSHQLLILRNE